MKVCDENNCDGQVVAWRWCQKHYWRWRKTGSPELSSRNTPDDWSELLEMALTGDKRCIETNTKRRPNISINGIAHSASRAVWIKKYGDPKEQFVLHKCNNDKCININHLYLGNYQQNGVDMANSGIQKGSKNPGSTLTEKQVLEIRKLNGIKPHSEIGKLFNITQSNVTYIINRKTWRHI